MGGLWRVATLRVAWPMHNFTLACGTGWYNARSVKSHLRYKHDGACSSLTNFGKIVVIPVDGEDNHPHKCLNGIRAIVDVAP